MVSLRCVYCLGDSCAHIGIVSGIGNAFLTSSAFKLKICAQYFYAWYIGNRKRIPTKALRLLRLASVCINGFDNSDSLTATFLVNQVKCFRWNGMIHTFRVSRQSCHPHFATEEAALTVNVNGHTSYS
jgi:hypothetical protein